jgi:hypothetical protein
MPSSTNDYHWKQKWLLKHQPLVQKRLIVLGELYKSQISSLCSTWNQKDCYCLHCQSVILI